MVVQISLFISCQQLLSFFSLSFFFFFGSLRRLRTPGIEPELSKRLRGSM